MGRGRGEDIPNDALYFRRSSFSGLLIWGRLQESLVLAGSGDFDRLRDLLMKKYQIVYADPPWSYNDKLSSVSKGDFRFRGAGSVYPTQSKEWIEGLPIKDIADNNAVLFLWAVSPLLPEAFGVMEAWGFKYKTLAFCWVKETPLFNSVKNLGRWTMGGVELCLLGTKGKPKRARNNIRQVCHEIRTTHSKKPDEIRKRIVELMGDVPRVELFAREKHDGWDVFGNEVESDIDLMEPTNDLQKTERVC